MQNLAPSIFLQRAIECLAMTLAYLKTTSFKYLEESTCEHPMFPLILVLQNIVSGKNYREINVNVNLKI